MNDRIVHILCILSCKVLSIMQSVNIHVIKIVNKTCRCFIKILDLICTFSKLFFFFLNFFSFFSFVFFPFLFYFIYFFLLLLLSAPGCCEVRNRGLGLGRKATTEINKETNTKQNSLYTHTGTRTKENLPRKVN